MQTHELFCFLFPGEGEQELRDRLRQGTNPLRFAGQSSLFLGHSGMVGLEGPSPYGWHSYSSDPSPGKFP